MPGKRRVLGARRGHVAGNGGRPAVSYSDGTQAGRTWTSDEGPARGCGSALAARHGGIRRCRVPSPAGPVPGGRGRVPSPAGPPGRLSPPRRRCSPWQSQPTGSRGAADSRPARSCFAAARTGRIRLANTSRSGLSRRGRRRARPGRGPVGRGAGRSPLPLLARGGVAARAGSATGVAPESRGPSKSVAATTAQPPRGPIAAGRRGPALAEVNPLREPELA